MSAKPRGLGRGLDELLPKVEKGVRQVSLDDLEASPRQPRRTIEDAAIAELATSIRRQGILQPLLVRPSGRRLEIVAGERRFRAAKRAGLSEVPVIVRELSDQEALEIAIVENLQREDLNPVDEARALEQLLGFGLNQEKIARAIGKSRSAVSNTLRLLKLPASALETLAVGRISAGHARAILAQDEADMEWALDQIVRRDLSVREAESLRRPAEGKGRSRRTASIYADMYADLERDLTRHVSAKVRIKGEKRGRIEIHFHSPDELERLLDLLGYMA